MRIVNQTKNQILAEEAVLADTLPQRMKGLLGRKEFKHGEALILKPCNSIHTFFMRFPIDVLFLDKNKRVVKAIPDLKPFRISNIYFSSVLAVELPANTIQATSTTSGDLISLD